MAIVLTATFETRREAEMTIERLVQEFDLDRTTITVTTEGDANSAGEEAAGADSDGDDPALNGALVVSVDVTDEETADRVRDAFGEFNAAGVVETDTAE